MIRLERLTGDATRINRFVNDPSVFPLVKGSHVGPFDLSVVAKNPDHVVLVGEHGGVTFIKHQLGIYEAHTAVLPEGRGEWTIELGRSALHWMFSHTDAFEILTKCPKGNLAAVAGARAIGGKFDFTTRPIWPTDDGLVPVDVYSMRIQEWVRTAPSLVELGHEFHERLAEQFKARGRAAEIHADDEVHDRYVGAAVAMIVAGQIQKGVWFYNRWAVMAAYMPIAVLSVTPFIINIGSTVLKVTGDQFEVCDANGWN